MANVQTQAWFPTSDPDPRDRDDDDSTSFPFAIGDVVGGGRYRLGELLGAGGMGVVYGARDLRLDRPVAIKVARTPELRPALRAEARALAAVRHPGVVVVHAMDEQDGHDLLVMERLVGRSLQARIDEAARTKRRFGIGETIDLLAALADVLSAAHAAGLAHRDLKPGNVMVCGARVVLVDFGLVMPEVEIGHHDLAAGSAEYVAPEVILRAVAPGQGPLVDLYALGVLGFELLTGRTPFAARTVEQTLQNHLTKPVPDLGALRPEAPPGLVALIVDLLRREPDARPPSAEAVLWQLSALRGPDARVAGVAPLSIYVVDDDPAIGAVLRRTLKRAMPQLAVEAETDPAVAIAEIERRRPDLVLLDVNMPGLNGIEVCMALAALPAERRPVVIAMSAEADARDVEVLRTLGVHAFVRKDDGFVARMAAVVGELRRGR